jgi:hypothetical protein
MEKRGEPFLLVVPRGLPYAIQRVGHACPVLRPERALLARLIPALRSTNSAAVGTALFAGFSRRMPPACVRIATISGSDFSCPCSNGFGSSPSRRGPDSPKTIRSDARSPRFRSVPFVRDGVFDHDGVSAPCIAVPHILPSALGDGLGLRHFQNFRGSISHPTQLLCTLRGRRRRRATQHSLPGGCWPLPGPDLHRLDQISLS